MRVRGAQGPRRRRPHVTPGRARSRTSRPCSPRCRPATPTPGSSTGRTCWRPATRSRASSSRRPRRPSTRTRSVARSTDDGAGRRAGVRRLVLSDDGPADPGATSGSPRRECPPSAASRRCARASSGRPRRSAAGAARAAGRRAVVRADWRRCPPTSPRPPRSRRCGSRCRRRSSRRWCACVLGVPLAVVLARAHGWPADVLRALVTLPLVLPPTVGGIALLLPAGPARAGRAVARRWFGITIPFTTAAVVIAQTFVAMPFLVLARRGVAAHGGHAVRGRRREPRRRPLDRAAPHHPAARHAGAGQRDRAVLRARARRVRRDRAVRGQRPGRHAAPCRWRSTRRSTAPA